MKFELVDHSHMMGTSGQGDLHATFAELVAKLGNPNAVLDTDKIDACWVIRFEDGTVATVYNWKDGRNWLGDDGLDVEDITEWSVGGKDWKAVDALQELFGDKAEEGASRYGHLPPAEVAKLNLPRGWRKTN
jgi:hypothetical protein